MTPIKLTPALRPYTLKILAHRLVAPIIVVLAVARILSAFGFAVSPVLVAVLAVACVPTTYAASVVYRDWSVHWRAALVGAVLPPSWEGKRFANVDILEHSIERFHNGYLGGCYVNRYE